MTRSITIFALWLTVQFIIAETLPTIEHITSNNGLSHNTVRCMLQDRTGFLWFGTLNGLNRYDGIKIKSIIPETRNPNSLTSGKIKDLYEDSHGHIWVKTYSDIFHCYDPKTESFLPIFKDYDDFFIKHNSFSEDINGNVWLGSSANGCLRIQFSGNNINIRSYSTEDPKHRLPSNTILDILHDKDGQTWALTSGGAVTILPDGNVQKVDLPKSQEIPVKVYEIQDDIYLISGNGAIHVFNRNNRKLRQSFANPYPFTMFRSTILDQSKILISTELQGIYIFDPKSKQMLQADGILGERVRGNIHFVNDKKGGIWFYNHSGRVWNISNKLQVKSLRLIPPSIMMLIDEERYQFIPDNYGNIWISTYGNGIFKYHTNTGILSHYHYDKFNDDISSNYILSILHDKNENIWIGTENMGINKLTFTNRAVKQIFLDPGNNIRNGNVIRSFLEDSKGNIWVANKAGSLYLYNNKLTQRRTIFENSFNIYSIFEDKEQNIWLGTRGNGVMGLRKGNPAEIINYRATDSGSSLSENHVFDLTKDNKNRLWVATFGGGVSVKTEPEGSNGFRTFFDDDDWVRFARYIFYDSSGDMWVATSNGVLRFNPDSLLNNRKKYRYYTFDNKDETSLSNPEVRYIYEDSKKNIWLATSGGGLNRFIGESKNGNGQFEVYKNEQGIANDNIMAILEDEAGFLWLSTEAGLQKFNPENSVFQLFKFSSDFAANIFSEATALKTRNGHLLWGTLNGFFYFDPGELTASAQASNKVIFTGFAVFNTDALIGQKRSPLKTAIPFADKITLRHSDQVFHIEFSTLSFCDPKANQFRFILENYEKRWNTTTGEQNVATYRNVPPGNYTFKVRSINSEGTWDDQYSQIEVVIKPPYWKSDLAYTIYVLLILTIIYFTFKIVLNFYNLHNAVKVERQLTDYKLRFFTNISHEFRTPLTLIKGSIDTLNEVKDKLSQPLQKIVTDIDKNTSHLLRLIEQLLEFRKLQNNKQSLQLQRVEAIGFLKEICSSFDNVAAKTNIDFQFVCNQPSVPVYLDKNKVDKIIFNLLSNAFKFTPRGGKIMISVKTDDPSQSIRISVADNGIGIPAEKQHLLFSRFMQINFSEGTGIGLHLVSEFTALHQGKVQYQPNDPQGSIFTVEFPLNSSVYKEEDFVKEKVIAVSDNEQEVQKLSDFIEESNADVMLDLVPIVPVAGKKYNVLIIDDNDDIREFLETKLSPYYEIATAPDGNIGIHKSRSMDPDLIICDVMMPGMSGFELTKQLKDDFETCHIPVILLTAYIADEHLSEGVEAGADAYITKPFNMKHLMLQMNKLLEKRELLRRHYTDHQPERVTEAERTADEALSTQPSAEVVDENVNTEPASAGVIELSSLIAKDKYFLGQVEEILQQQLGDPNFNVDDFAEQLNTGRTLFFKKIKSLTGYSPNEFIRLRRMQKAAELLKTYQFNVSEVSYMVGINDPFYFSKCFKAQYGCSPSKYMNS